MPKTDHGFLLQQVERCQRLARQITDEETRRRLMALAVEYQGRIALAAQDGRRSEEASPCLRAVDRSPG